MCIEIKTDHRPCMVDCSVSHTIHTCPCIATQTQLKNLSCLFFSQHVKASLQGIKTAISGWPCRHSPVRTPIKPFLCEMVPGPTDSLWRAGCKGSVCDACYLILNLDASLGRKLSFAVCWLLALYAAQPSSTSLWHNCTPVTPVLIVYRHVTVQTTMQTLDKGILKMHTYNRIKQMRIWNPPTRCNVNLVPIISVLCHRKDWHNGFVCP